MKQIIDNLENLAAELQAIIEANHELQLRLIALDKFLAKEKRNESREEKLHQPSR